MTVKTIMAGELAVNCYILSNKNKECIIIDPGGDDQKISAYMEKNSLIPKAIVLTHSHFDHIMAVLLLKEKYNLPVAIYEEEAELLADEEKNLSLTLRGRGIAINPDILLKEGEEYFGLRIIHTPGHTKGGACFYSQEDAILFSGDTLFSGSIGRSDLYTGSHEALIDSIKTKLLTLPEDTAVYPGHGPKTTIGHEKARNPFLI